ncbi:MAG TPA: tyrosine-protein phosphatase [Gemmataceae bacterium]|nr:tyrosine-protein phosphatase [Gemmataceae bacterium]
MTRIIRGAVAAALVGVIFVVPAVYCRYVGVTSKRLRTVDPGRFYRSGQMTAEGFADAVERFHIRTIVNVQTDVPDPDIDRSYWSCRTIKESELCRKLGVRYVHLVPTFLPSFLIPENRLSIIDQLLYVLHDEANYPVLIHCYAGLHRTGLLTAIYRMKFQGWTREQAFLDMTAQGPGKWSGKWKVLLQINR